MPMTQQYGVPVFEPDQYFYGGQANLATQQQLNQQQAARTLAAQGQAVQSAIAQRELAAQVEAETARRANAVTLANLNNTAQRGDIRLRNKGTLDVVAAQAKAAQDAAKEQWNRLSDKEKEQITRSTASYLRNQKELQAVREELQGLENLTPAEMDALTEQVIRQSGAKPRQIEIVRAKAKANGQPLSNYLDEISSGASDRFNQIVNAEIKKRDPKIKLKYEQMGDIMANQRSLQPFVDPSQLPPLQSDLLGPPIPQENRPLPPVAAASPSTGTGAGAAGGGIGSWMKSLWPSGATPPSVNAPASVQPTEGDRLNPTAAEVFRRAQAVEAGGLRGAASLVAQGIPGAMMGIPGVGPALTMAGVPQAVYNKYTNPLMQRGANLVMPQAMQRSAQDYPGWATAGNIAAQTMIPGGITKAGQMIAARQMAARSEALARMAGLVQQPPVIPPAIIPQVATAGMPNVPQAVQQMPGVPNWMFGRTVPPPTAMNPAVQGVGSNPYVPTGAQLPFQLGPSVYNPTGPLPPRYYPTTESLSWQFGIPPQ